MARGEAASSEQYRLQPGEFPPEGVGRMLSGELIEIDHINRQGVLRMDRGDDQTKVQWDRPQPFALLPFGAVTYHGAPAELRDIPLGTHLYGEFFEGAPVERYPDAYNQFLKRNSPYLSFSRAALLEDDFSRSLRLGRTWRVENVDATAGYLNVTGIGRDGKLDAQQTKFAIGQDTIVWKGPCMTSLADLAPGQSVILNLTACTLTGPGRCTDVWVDDESRAVAAAHQLERHRRYQREHGLAGWVDRVDNQAAIVSVVLFGGIDARLIEDFLTADAFRAAVAEDSLRTFDQVNDKKEGPGEAARETSDRFGHGGIRVTFQPGPLLEGFRPGKVVRLWPGTSKTGRWKLDHLPREETLYVN